MLDNVSSLDEIIGVAIGFTTIMLLLSLVVTAIVQIIQSLFGLRRRNLALGIRLVLLKALPDRYKESVAEITDSVLQPPLREVGKWWPRVTWIEPDTLADGVEKKIREIDERKETNRQEETGRNKEGEKAAPPAGDSSRAGAQDLQKDKIETEFKSIYGHLSKRFSISSRTLSAVCAFLVAFFFQIDALDLLRRLSTDQELRTQLELTAAGLIDQEGQIAFEALSYEDISDSALTLLQDLYPELAPQLEQASGIGVDSQDIADELDDIMTAERPEMRDEVLEVYGELLQKLYLAGVETGLQRYERFTGRLAVFDIRLLSYGWNYYNLQHLLGILITTMFLSFGAPFWFEQLKRFVNLKELLRRQEDKKESDSKSSG